MSRPLTSFLNSAICASLVVLLTSPAAMAQTWDGETSTNWGTGTNWAPNGVPAISGSVIINDGGNFNQPLINAGDSFTVQQTAISAGSLTIGGSLTSNVTVSGTGVLTIQGGGDLTGNVTNSGTVNNSGVVTGNVSNAGTLQASNGASFDSLSNDGLLILSGVPNIVGTLALGESSILSIDMAGYQPFQPVFKAGAAELDGLLIFDFSDADIDIDFFAFNFIQGPITGDFSDIELLGAPDFSFSTFQGSNSNGDFYRVTFERMITTPVPEPEIYAMLGLGLGLMGWVGRRRKLQQTPA